MNFNFNFRKNWPYLAFIIPYIIISLLTLVQPSLISVFSYSREGIDHFQYYRFITMFFIDNSIISVIVTAIISYYFFVYLSAIMQPVKQVISLALAMVLSGAALYFIPVTASVNNLSVGLGFLLYTLIFFFAMIASVFIYNEELLAKTFVSRYSLLFIVIVAMTILNGIILIFLNMIIAASCFIVVFIVYYFTKAKPGYSI